jgi:hypothetical protein
MAKFAKIKKRFFKWNDLSFLQKKNMGEPLTLKEWAEKNGIHIGTARKWVKEAPIKLEIIDKPIPAEWKKEEPVLDKRVEEQVKKMDSVLFEKALESRSAQERMLFYKRHGLLVDKSESTVKTELNASDYYRLYEQLKDLVIGCPHVRNGGVCPLLQGPTLLPREVRVDSDTERPPQENQVAALGLPVSANHGDSGE